MSNSARATQEMNTGAIEERLMIHRFVYVSSGGLCLYYLNAAFCVPRTHCVSVCEGVRGLRVAPGWGAFPPQSHIISDLNDANSRSVWCNDEGTVCFLVHAHILCILSLMIRLKHLLISPHVASLYLCSVLKQRFILWPVFLWRLSLGVEEFLALYVNIYSM